MGKSGEGNGNPLQYSCLENPIDGEAWWATVHGVTETWTWLSDLTHTRDIYTFLESSAFFHLSPLAGAKVKVQRSWRHWERLTRISITALIILESQRPKFIICYFAEPRAFTSPPAPCLTVHILPASTLYGRKFSNDSIGRVHVTEEEGRQEWGSQGHWPFLLLISDPTDPLILLILGTGAGRTEGNCRSGSQTFLQVGNTQHLWKLWMPSSLIQIFWLN